MKNRFLELRLGDCILRLKVDPVKALRLRRRRIRLVIDTGR